MKHAQRALAEANHWPILEPIEADGQVNPIALSKPVCVAGSRHRVNLPLNSPQISRSHALFVADADVVYLRDLASLNGVNVNDAPVREAVLHNGDVVQIGPFSFRCAQNFRDGATELPHAPAAELRLEDGAKVPLTGHTLLIGSRESCDIHISDPKISPAHAVVFDRDGRWFIRDLRSARGTRVNGELVGEIKLEPGDAIEVGDAQLTFAPRSAQQTAPQEPADEIDASLAVGMDEISLAADDSLAAQAPPAEVTPAAGRPTEPPAPKPSEDSAIIPLIEDEDDAAKPSARPAPVPQPHPVQSESKPQPPAAKPLLDDSSLIPIALEDSAAAVPSPAAQPKPAAQDAHPLDAQPAAARPLLDSSLIPVAVEPESSQAAAHAPEAPKDELAVAKSSPEDLAVIPTAAEPQASAAPQASITQAEEPPLATAEELLDEPATGELPSNSQLTTDPPRTDHSGYPGTIDRQKAEEVFSELLDDLAENVEEVQTVWQDLKTTNPDEPPSRKRQPTRRKP